MALSRMADWTVWSVSEVRPIRITKTIFYVPWDR